jgi:hypothetical protein
LGSCNHREFSHNFKAGLFTLKHAIDLEYRVFVRNCSGGNALLQRGQPLEAAIQRCKIEVATAAIATVAQAHIVIVTHGNGPQVGLLALQAEAYPTGRCLPTACYPICKAIIFKINPLPSGKSSHALAVSRNGPLP